MYKYQVEYFREWTKEEDDQLNTLYNVDMFPIMKIYEKMDILPWFINKRLYEQKYLEKNASVRGYIEYHQSPIYQTSPTNVLIWEIMRGLGGGIAYSN